MVVARDNAQCSTRRALFSQGNSLEKGRERRQQHVRPVDGCTRSRCNGDIFGDDAIRVRWPRRSEPTIGLVRLPSPEVLPRVVVIPARARLTLSRAQFSVTVAPPIPARLNPRPAPGRSCSSHGIRRVGGVGGMGREAAEDNLICVLMSCASPFRPRSPKQSLQTL